jgi:tyrosyl-tRNA synthetase
MNQQTPLLDELRWRGMLHQHTETLAEALTRSTLSGYAGFDPSAPSLHVGHLVPVMGLAHLQRAGHRPIVLVGGGTGMIGDPSGRSTERQLHSPEQVEENTRGLRNQLARFLDFEGPNAARLVNNAEWLLPLNAITFMRDVGKHFTINYMLAKDSVKARIDSGISYTEFSYMLLQAYDYLELHRREGVSLQLGGSDQWGNITAGMELIRRTAGADAHALTLQLLTNASGAKFGKSEGGNVWLDPERTSPYRFYQFWINTDDRDVGRNLRYFTLLQREEIESLEGEVAEHPERRAAQVRLANDVTERVHGAEAARTAREVSAFIFGDMDPAQLSTTALELLRAEAPFTEVDEPQLFTTASGDANGGSAGRYDVYKLLTVTGIAASNGAARRLLEQGGVSVNRRKLAADERYIEPSSALLAGDHVIIAKGRKEYALVRVRR